MLSKSQIVQLLTIIAEMYSKFEVNRDKIELWHELIGDLPYQVADAAIKKVIMTSEFAPTVAAVRKAAVDITTSNRNILDAGMAWGEVTSAISKCGYPEPEKAYAMMSPVTLKVVMQMTWREICCSEELGVTRGQFMRMYDTLKARKEQDKILPEKFKETIKLMADKMDIKKLT